MRASRQVAAESAVIATVLVAIALGGSLAASSVPPGWNDGRVSPYEVGRAPSLGALALYYNSTLAALGTGRFANASLLLGTFGSVDVPPSAEKAAFEANGYLAAMNSSMPSALSFFDETEAAIQAKEYVNATTLVDQGCSEGTSAGESLSAFQGEAPILSALSVPAAAYAPGEALAVGEVGALRAQCDNLRSELPGVSANLTISSPQPSFKPGGETSLEAELTVNGSGVGGQVILFYAGGSYFGSLVTNPSGGAEGQLPAPPVYTSSAVVQAVAAPNATARFGGARSNALNFTVVFDATKIVLANPPALYPTSVFRVSGNLTTAGGAPVAGARVTVTFVNQTEDATTGQRGGFSANFTVPADAGNGIHYVYAAFAAEGVLGPSSDFTSMDVVREALAVDVSPPPLAFAGFDARLTGMVVANGSGVAGALVTVSTPWGVSTGATTSPSGRFSAPFHVSPSQLLLGAQVTLSVAPTEPYLSSSSASARLEVLNPLLAVAPLLLLGLASLRIREAREFRRLGRGGGIPGGADVGTRPAPGAAPAAVSGHPVPEVLRCYRRAVALAVSRFGLELGETLTVRETVGRIVASEDSAPSDHFAAICYAAEAYLYSDGFDPARVAEAEDHLAAVEEAWG